MAPSDQLDADTNGHNPESESQQVADRHTEQRQNLEKWLQTRHEQELEDFVDRLPGEAWIKLSVETLAEVCGTDLRDDLLENVDAIEEGSSGYPESLAIKTVIVESVAVDVIADDITIRWTDLPDRRLIGDYRAGELERLFAVEGQIEATTEVDPVIEEAAFECLRCGSITRISQKMTDEELLEPHECPGCERQGPFDLDKDESEHVDHQELQLQTPPEHAQDGVETLTVSLTNGLAGQYTGELGQKVVVNGYLTTKDTKGWKRPYRLQAREVELLNEVTVDVEAYQDEIDSFREENDPVGKIVDSKIGPKLFAPEGSDLRLLKFAVLLQACSSHRLNSSQRGDIHVLACGDPSTGKTEVAELAAEVMPRSEFVSSRTTGVGLTAAADHDDLSGWTIKSGAIVRANNGMLIIDELDKIDSSEIHDLHTPMASQKVKAAVADQKASLPAETSVLATANPEFGRFDKFEPIGEQFDMPPSLLSRFDLIVTLTDQPDAERDGKLASSVMDGFKTALQAERNKTGQDSVDDNVGFLRAWVAEAREYLPRFPDKEETRLRNFYKILRQKGDDEDSPVPVAPRQVEGMMRLAIASARARHSGEVEDVDIDRAIWLVKQTLQGVGIDPETGELDADLIETGESKSQRDRRKLVRTTVRELCREHETGAPYAEIVEEMVADGISEEKAEHAIEKSLRKGELYEPEDSTYRLT